MKICPTHWTALRAAIASRGLGHLVAPTGEQAHEKLLSELHGAPEKDVFDPLMCANMEIFSAALTGGGAAMMQLDDQGQHKCPLCEVEKSGIPASDWIEGAASDAHARAVQLGLVAKVS